MISTREPKSFKLPNKPSALLRAALKDLEKIEKNPEYRVDMFTWHEPVDGDAFAFAPDARCEVCLAGAVMACRSGATTEMSLHPGAFDDAELSGKLEAIDCLRKGDVYDAFSAMNISHADELDLDRDIPQYIHDPDKFKAALYELAGELKKAGH